MADAKKTEPQFRSLKEIVIDRNEKFRSQRIDVLAGVWRDFTLAKIDQIYDLGLHGVFLDTVDTVDVYITRSQWPLPRRVKSVNAMMSFILQVKTRDTSQFVLQNRGLNLIGKTVFVGNEKGVEIKGLSLAKGVHGNPDAVLWENAFHGNDAWSRVKLKQLQAVQASGHANVFALGYETTYQNRAAFFARAAGEKFIPAWATSSERLHLELTTN